jgi:gamma-glutamylcyclotransferase (GGCT)/AIG2-like uncharacterized protein YtfP
MTPYFSYGANMDVTGMRRRCPQARPLGPARLDGWRFVIGAEGYGSVMRQPGRVVHGVLWLVSPRDRAALDIFEDVAGGLYARRIVRVHAERGAVPALVYVGNGRGLGQPQPGYLDLVISAARGWRLNDRYLMELMRWRSTGLAASRPPDPGAITY